MENEKVQGSMEVLNSLQMTAETAGLDQASKEIYKNKEVLAIILKGVVKEYADYSYREIMDFIEGDSITDSKSVTPGLTNTRIQGDGKEFAALNEKLSNFDTEFSAINPRLSNQEILVRLHIDLEPQKTYRPGYPLEKRGIYYLAREFSSQLSLTMEDTDYNHLEKCYSIWLCRDDIPQDERFSVSMIEMANTKNYGNCHPNPDNYDMLTLVIVRLGSEVYQGMEDKEMDNMMEFVHAIMYPHKEEFLATVKKHIDFSNNEKLWKELNGMSGLGASVAQECYSKGKKEGIEGTVVLLQSLKQSAEQIKEMIMSQFGLTEAEAEQYLK